MVRLRQILYIFCNFFLRLFRGNVKVVIVSSDKYKNKVTEDLMLSNALLLKGVSNKIVSYSDNLDWSKFNLIIIRSVWGYQNDIDTFSNFLSKIRNYNVINDVDFVISNLDKVNQIDLLNKNDIKFIDTKVIDNIDDYLEYLNNSNGDFVIKPSISASGNKTYLVSDKDGKNHISREDSIDVVKDIVLNSRLLLQPFCKEIENGELSLISFGSKVLYGIVRYPAVLNDTLKISYLPLSKIDGDALNLTNKVLNIKEFNECTIVRSDLLKAGEDYKVMEIEVIDPQIFLKSIPKEVRKDIINNLVDCILKKI